MNEEIDLFISYYIFPTQAYYIFLLLLSKKLDLKLSYDKIFKYSFMYYSMIFLLLRFTMDFTEYAYVIILLISLLVFRKVNFRNWLREEIYRQGYLRGNLVSSTLLIIFMLISALNFSIYKLILYLYLML